jgi:HSP20 family protein
VLTLKASAEAESEEKAQNWYRRERRQGTWVRQVTLPTDVSSDKAEANVEHGVLRLTLPKADSARPQSIKVSTQPVLEASKN